MSKKCFLPADILIPENIDMEKWSVVACDQYTSQPEYWKKVALLVGDAPSTLKITLPEIYLETPDKAERIVKINENMHSYIPLLREYPSSFIYVERNLPRGRMRRGLIGMLDLEEYDFSVSSTSLIRATEGTVTDRIPPRVAVRQDALFELPHIMVLADDPLETVIEPLTALKHSMKKMYDFELMMGGGHISGYLVPAEYNEKITDAYIVLANTHENTAPLLFAMGDGNHSLATAKTCYENLKKMLPEAEYKSHPARYALVELCNLHDSSLEFEAIHRVLFGVNATDVIEAFLDYCSEHSASNAVQKFVFCYGDTRREISVNNPPSSVAAGTLQTFLDGYIAETHVGIDFIHGADVAAEIGSRNGNLGIILESMNKASLFDSVAKDGTLPRKTFSMGEAFEKRFYLEARKIRSNI